MKLALLAGATAALSSWALAGARAETIYITEPGDAYVTTYDDAVVADSPAVVVEPRRRVVVVPRRSVVAPPVEVIDRRERVEYVAPADSFAYRGTVRRSYGGYVTTGYSGACAVGIDGIERCY